MPLLRLAPALFAAAAWARELKYPPGMQPGMKAEGMAGEFSRYSSVLVKPPDDEDRAESLEMAVETRCDTCEVLLTSLMKRVESHSEDHILDALEGVPMEMPPPTDDDAQVNRVNANRVGCNKHFKDELIHKGYYVRKCADIAAEKLKAKQAANVKILSDSDEPEDEPEKDAEEAEEEAKPMQTHCLHKRDNLNVDERQANTYSVRSEALFFGCEHTVGKYSHEIGTFLAEGLEDGSGALDALIVEACRKMANCDGLKPRREPKHKKAAGQPKAKKKTKDKEESVWDILEEEKAQKKKKRKGRKATSKPHREL